MTTYNTRSLKIVVRVPEGATHYEPGTAGWPFSWFKRGNDCWFYWSRIEGKWRTAGRLYLKEAVLIEIEYTDSEFKEEA